MYTHVLVPLDGSRFAEHALPAVLPIARRAGAVIHLVRVHLALLPDSPITPPEVDELAKRAEREYLAEVAARVRRRTPYPVDTMLAEGPVIGAIEAEAMRVGAQLIVMTTHGRTGMSRVWLGSVADGLLRRSNVPVLLIRPREDEPDLSREATFREILIALDGSRAAEAIADHALRLGQLTGARYTIMRVVAPAKVPRHPYAYAAAPFEVDPGATERRVTEAEQYLAEVASRMRRSPGTGEVATFVCVDEHPAVSILRTASGSVVDLIAMTTGAHGLSRLLLGSVVDKVLRSAEVPMLLYRPPER
jgi:nucleotide-binding universal stress UspA family protein